jgi:hypothetical protein
MIPCNSVRFLLRLLAFIGEVTEHRRPSFLEIAILLQTTLQQRFHAPLCFRPRQGDLKGVDSIQEPVGRWQRDLID